jgi:hypothetical protein
VNPQAGNTSIFEFFAKCFKFWVKKRKKNMYLISLDQTKLHGPGKKSPKARSAAEIWQHLLCPTRSCEFVRKPAGIEIFRLFCFRRSGISRIIYFEELKEERFPREIIALTGVPYLDVRNHMHV